MGTSVPIIRNPGEGDKRSFFGGGLHTWKLMADDTGGDFFLFEDEMSEGKMTPLHLHPDADETTYVLAGEIRVVVAGKETRLGPGSVSYVPKGVEHAFIVVSETARLLTMQTPAVGQAFYRDASEPALDDVTDRLDIPRLQATAAETGGVQLLGPPPFAPAHAPN